MDREHTGNRVLPQRYKDILFRLDATKQSIAAIDKQIEGLSRSQGPKPGLNPPGYIPPNYSGLIAYLKETKDKLQSDTIKAIEKETESFSPEDRRLIRDIVREELYPNPYRTVAQDQGIDQKEESKDLEQSQDYMDKKVRPSFGERFTKTLKYNEAFRNGRDITSPTREIEPDRDH